MRPEGGSEQARSRVRTRRGSDHAVVPAGLLDLRNNALLVYTGAKGLNRMLVFRTLLAIAVLVFVAMILLAAAVAILVVGLASRVRGRTRMVQSTGSAVIASVVIPTWNGRDLLEQCLPSIVEDVASTHGSHEIIVVDNASTDDTSCLILERFPGVRVVRLETNEGFGEGCNAGVRAACGKYVVVLNNDMKVEPGFLRELLAGFQRPDTFAVTAQIFFWDAEQRREETGLTRGGFVRGQLWLTHDLPEDDDWVTYPAVLYAGGGSTAYDRGKFLAMGGFDPLYHPFYVEDVDLSYRAWRRGWPSVFAPRARVLHKHRGTIGRHFDRRYILDIVERNKLLFTWSNVSDPVILVSNAVTHSLQLATGALHGKLNLRPTRLALGRFTSTIVRVWRDRRDESWSDGTVVSLATDQVLFRDRFAPVSSPLSADRLKIVFLSPYALFPPRHGGAARMYNIVKRLAARHSVRLYCYVDTEEEQREMADLEKIGLHVTTVIRRPPQRRFDSLGSIPLSVGDFNIPLMREALRSPAVAAADVFHVEYTQMAQFIRPSCHVLSVLAEVDVTFLSLSRRISQHAWLVPRLSSWFDWLRMFNYELDVCRKTDLVLAVSQDEADLLQSYLPGHPISAEAPTGVDVSHFQLRDQGSIRPFSVLFVGYFRHPPNVDAVLQLGQSIFPRLKERHPEATLTIVGGHPTPDVLALGADPSIQVLGYVDDVRDFYRTHAVLAAPIRSGAGTRVKILEAMAAGVPVVSTTIGAEGIQCRSGVDILIADEPQAFVRQLSAVLTSATHAQDIALAARQLVSSNYDWDAIVENLERLYRLNLQKKRQSGRPAD